MVRMCTSRYLLSWRDTKIEVEVMMQIGLFFSQMPKFLSCVTSFPVPSGKVRGSPAQPKE